MGVGKSSQDHDQFVTKDLPQHMHQFVPPAIDLFEVNKTLQGTKYHHLSLLKSELIICLEKQVRQQDGLNLLTV